MVRIGAIVNIQEQTMITSNSKFLELVTAEKLYPPLKSFSDSILFYYLGHLALQNKGEILEIGGGGSTYVLYELSENHDTTFNLCDMHKKFATWHNDYYPNAKVNPIIAYSDVLVNHQIGPFAYAHIDGDKDYNVTSADLAYCLDNLAVNGLICQDDYGNNKWPTITQAICKAVAEGKAKVLLIGDSSIWITKPEYYSYWMNKLATDREFEVLAAYLGVHEAEKMLSYSPNYYFINSLQWVNVVKARYEEVKNTFTEQEISTLREIDHHRHAPQYLKMPYTLQSTPGIWLD